MLRLKYTKYWGLVFLDLKFFEDTPMYIFRVNLIKIKVINKHNDLLGMPGLFFSLILKQRFNFFLTNFTVFRPTLSVLIFFFSFFQAFFVNSDAYYLKQNRLGCSIYNTPACILTYTNYNVFSMNYLFRVNYVFDFISSSDNKLLLRDQFFWLGLPNLYNC